MKCMREFHVHILTMELNITPYVILWYDVVPTFYHPIPLYHYDEEPQAYVSFEDIFFRSKDDTLSPHITIPNYIIRNPCIWQGVTRLWIIQKDGKKHAFCYIIRKSYALWHIVTLFICLCKKFFVSLGWLWVGVYTLIQEYGNWKKK